MQHSCSLKRSLMWFGLPQSFQIRTCHFPLHLCFHCTYSVVYKVKILPMMFAKWGEALTACSGKQILSLFFFILRTLLWLLSIIILSNTLWPFLNGMLKKLFFLINTTMTQIKAAFISSNKHSDQMWCWRVSFFFFLFFFYSMYNSWIEKQPALKQQHADEL